MVAKSPDAESRPRTAESCAADRAALIQADPRGMEAEDYPDLLQAARLYKSRN